MSTQLGRIRTQKSHEVRTSDNRASNRDSVRLKIGFKSCNLHKYILRSLLSSNYTEYTHTYIQKQCFFIKMNYVVLTEQEGKV